MAAIQAAFELPGGICRALTFMELAQTELDGGYKAHDWLASQGLDGTRDTVVSAALAMGVLARADDRNFLEPQPMHVDGAILMYGGLQDEWTPEDLLL